MKYKFRIKGMSCSACSNSIEKVVRKIEGVKQADVSLIEEILTVESDLDLSKNVITAVKKAGFKAFSFAEKVESVSTNGVKWKLISSIALLVLLMYVAMYEMFGLPIFEIISKNNPIVYIAVQLALALIVLIINNKFFINGAKAVIHGAPNMDTLVSIGSLSAFIYGVYSFVLVIIAKNSNDTLGVLKHVNNLYLESSAMIVTLVSVGKYLESLAKKRTESASQKLKDLAPKTATKVVDGEKVTVETSTLSCGDVVFIKEGETIPVDGIILNGKIEVNEASLTGESMPVLKETNAEVKASTICISGYAEIEVTAVSEDTEISKIIDYILSAEASKAPVQRLADKISSIFVPTVIAISLITFIIWFLITKSVENSISYAISVLVISCPCALGLATPVAVTVATGRCASKGILIKNAEVLENVGLVKTAFFDKTGTLTEGNPIVDKAYNITKEDFDAIASIESLSSHPLSTAITEYAENYNKLEVLDFKAETGKGVIGVVNGNEYLIGNLSLVKKCEMPKEIKEVASLSLKKGKTVVYVAKNGVILGFLDAYDKIKESSYLAIKHFKELGVKTIILSGDNKNAVNLTKEQLSIDEAHAEIYPKDKAEIVKSYKDRGLTAFIGDGINDSPALTVADVGVSVVNGTDIAKYSSNIILLNNNIENFASAVKIGQKTRKIIKQNLFWAFFYNVIGIPLAAGAFAFLGLSLSPMIASAFMSISSIFVVTNALRLQKL
ncbi:MAG: copper-translocating P-type ATPase [Clostridia bacterium]|nr:copper-translocating P-type ATPase [Clostridia bacterium]